MNDEKDEEFLRSINESIPKYGKTQKRMQEFIDFYHNHPGIQEKIKTEKTKLDQVIKNLKITQALYTKEDLSSKQSDFAEEDYSKDDYEIRAQQAISQSDNLEDSLHKILKISQSTHEEVSGGRKESKIHHEDTKKTEISDYLLL